MRELTFAQRYAVRFIIGTDHLQPQSRGWLPSDESLSAVFSAEEPPPVSTFPEIRDEVFKIRNNGAMWQLLLKEDGR